MERYTIQHHGKVDAGFSSEIILSDEARFHLDGFVNRQDCRVWGSEKPRAIGEKRTHPQRVTVWRGFWPGGVIGPYFFENEAGRAATVNGARYRDAITRFFLPKLDDIDAADTRFRRDGATCRAANQTIRLPRETFPGRALSRFGDRNRPPGSRDLTPLDFFLRDCSRWKVHVDDPATTRALREEIKRCVDEIRPRLRRKVMKNLDERVRMCSILCTLRLLKTLFYIRFKSCVNFGHPLYT